jgi:hypothetical protein
MSLSLFAQKTWSTPEVQLGEAPSEVPMVEARAKAAFGPPQVGTEHIGIEARQARVSTESRAAVAPPRGVRLASPHYWSGLVGFVTEQRWHGYVSSIEGDTFNAVVFDTEPSEGDEPETVEFRCDEVNELMRPLIAPGAIFFWDIGFQVDPGGQRLRQSTISFPMIPAVTKQQRDEAIASARSRFKELGWETSGGTDQSESATETR